MITTTGILVTKVVIDKLFCNLCGNEIEDPQEYGHEFATLRAEWGYQSKHDSDRVEIHFCESCVYEKIIPSLKIPPTINGRNDGHQKNST